VNQEFAQSFGCLTNQRQRLRVQSDDHDASRGLWRMTKNVGKAAIERDDRASFLIRHRQ
jgi:hypothetical protein